MPLISPPVTASLPHKLKHVLRSSAALPLAWAALLLYLTLAPAQALPPTPQWRLLSFDTFAHAAFFAVQALLTWLWLRHQTRFPRLARHAGWVVLLGGTLFGAGIEVLQMTLPFNRHGEWSDLISDSLGTAAALGLLKLAAGPLRRRGWALALLALLLGSAPAAQAQDMPRVRATIKKLASPKMHGRGYVKQGERKAADYLRGRLRQLKLEPLAPDYTQPFTLDVNTFPGKLRLQVVSKLSVGYEGKAQLPYTLHAGTDFILAPTSGEANGSSSALALRLDSSVFSSAHYQQQLQQQIRQMTALKRLTRPFLVVRAADEFRLHTLPTDVRQTLDSIPNRVILRDKLTASLAATQSQNIQFDALDNSKTWNFNGHNRQFGLLTFEVQAHLQRDYPTQNLAAIVRGSAQPDSFLVVTAHYDHLGRMGRRAYFPGANDNASGVALLLELAAHYARPENRPACSVAFLLFGAEEAGLLGSRHFVQHPLVPLRQIRFLINLDLLGTGEEGATVVNGRVHEVAFQQLQKLNDAGHYLPSLAARGRAANSDHFPFSEAGVPAFFIYTRGGGKAYHDVHDTAEKLSLAGFEGAFKLVRDFLDARGR